MGKLAKSLVILAGMLSALPALAAPVGILATRETYAYSVDPGSSYQQSGFWGPLTQDAAHSTRNEFDQVSVLGAATQTTTVGPDGHFWGSLQSSTTYDATAGPASTGGGTARYMVTFDLASSHHVELAYSLSLGSAVPGLTAFGNTRLRDAVRATSLSFAFSSGSYAFSGELGPGRYDFTVMAGTWINGAPFFQDIGSITSSANFDLRLSDPVTAIPEPETYAMLLAGLALMGWHRRRSAPASR